VRRAIPSLDKWFPVFGGIIGTSPSGPSSQPYTWRRRH